MNFFDLFLVDAILFIRKLRKGKTSCPLSPCGQLPLKGEPVKAVPFRGRGTALAVEGFISHHQYILTNGKRVGTLSLFADAKIRLPFQESLIPACPEEEITITTCFLLLITRSVGFYIFALFPHYPSCLQHISPRIPTNFPPLPQSAGEGNFFISTVLFYIRKTKNHPFRSEKHKKTTVFN